MDPPRPPHPLGSFSGPPLPPGPPHPLGSFGGPPLPPGPSLGGPLLPRVDFDGVGPALPPANPNPIFNPQYVPNIVNQQPRGEIVGPRDPMFGMRPRQDPFPGEPDFDELKPPK